jgi:hypothetical protein
VKRTGPTWEAELLSIATDTHSDSAVPYSGRSFVCCLYYHQYSTPRTGGKDREREKRESQAIRRRSRRRRKRGQGREGKREEGRRRKLPTRTIKNQPISGNTACRPATAVDYLLCAACCPSLSVCGDRAALSSQLR